MSNGAPVPLDYHSLLNENLRRRTRSRAGLSEWKRSNIRSDAKEYPLSIRVFVQIHWSSRRPTDWASQRNRVRGVTHQGDLDCRREAHPQPIGPHSGPAWLKNPSIGNDHGDACSGIPSGHSGKRHARSDGRRNRLKRPIGREVGKERIFVSERRVGLFRRVRRVPRTGIAGVEGDVAVTDRIADCGGPPIGLGVVADVVKDDTVRRVLEAYAVTVLRRQMTRGYRIVVHTCVRHVVAHTSKRHAGPVHILCVIEPNDDRIRDRAAASSNDYKMAVAAIVETVSLNVVFNE